MRGERGRSRSRNGVDPNLAKLARPALKRVVARPRLFRKLDSACRQPLVWITGPAGSGKTTLLSAYVESRRLPVLWFQMDEGDADPATFFHYLGLAARKAAPRRRKPMPHLTPEYQPGVRVFARRFFEELCVRLPDHALIVFDNFHELPDGAPLVEVLAAAFSALPEGISVVVLSREAMPKAFSRFRAADCVATLGWDDLKLSEAESARLWKLHTDTPLSETAAAQLHRRLRGWAAGLVLLSRAGDTRSVSGDPLTDGDTSEVFDYFAGEIFDAADAETQDFLLKTAFLPSMTVEMAAGISGNPGAQRLLQSLYRRNFFTERRRGPACVYQYHPLFRDYLLMRGREAFAGAPGSELRRKAARLLMERQRFEEAGELLIEARDWHSLARLAVDQAPRLSGQGRCGVLENWFGQLPEEVVAELPWIAYWRGMCLLPFNPGQAGEWLQQALDAFTAAGDAFGAYLSWSGVVDSILFGFENFAALDACVARFDAMTRQLGPVPEGPAAVCVAASMYTALVQRRVERPDFEHWEASALALTASNPVVRAQVLLLNMFDKINRGGVAAVGQVFDTIEQMEGEAGLPPLARFSILVAKVMYFGFMARPADCLDTVRQGMELAEASGVHAMDFMLLGNGTLGALGNEDVDTARSLLDRMKGMLREARPWDLAFYHFLEAWQALLAAEGAEARRHVDTALSLTAQVGAPASAACTRLLDAHILFASGDTGKALARIDELMADGCFGRYPFWRFMADLARATFQADSDRPAAVASLRAAMATGKREGYFNTLFFWRSQPMAALCRLALEEGIEPEYVRALVRRRGLVPEHPPLFVEAWPWPVRIYTLGRFSLLRDDEPLEFSGKGKHKLLEMLKLLIALGGRGVREERVSDFLWPDADGDAAHSNFKTTLSRLRKWLGDETLILFRDGRLSLDDRRCWVDAWAFERAMSGAEADTVTEANVARVETALSFYRGAFLQGDDADWTLSTRERLRRRYLQGLLELGLYREKLGQWDKAAECYRAGLRVEDLAEELYQRLMRCYDELGLRAEALVTFEQCRAALNGAFGVDPSARTRALYRAICRDA